MPSHHLSRRDSWPPTIVHLSAPADLPDMDDNPFPHFLDTPSPYDDDLDFALDLSAGIERDDDHTAAKVREVSPSSLQRRHRDAELDLLESDMRAWLAAPLSLRDTPSQQAKTSSRSHTSADRLAPPPPARGRGVLQLAPSGAGRGRTRSLSARRLHSWREPSPEIARIEEVDEGMGTREETPGLSDATTEVGEGEEMPRRKSKPKKRVRWALPDEK